MQLNAFVHCLRTLLALRAFARHRRDAPVLRDSSSSLDLSFAGDKMRQRRVSPPANSSAKFTPGRINESWPRGGEFCMRIFVLVVMTVVAIDGNKLRPVLRTNFGHIRGKWSISARNLNVANYLAIPYAEPPVGELRFKEPQPWKRSWLGYRDCTKDAPICVQLDRDGKFYGKEDCLYLNVYVPMIPSPQTVNVKLAVMVFVHGGAFKTGSGNSKAYAPDYLTDQEVILVTLNYRLSTFGFFSTASKAAPGNNGLKDILTALRWVNENIGHFGGDPDSVTLVGQSAGASAVHHLSLTNKTAGLFDKYILQSGSALAPWAIHPWQTIRRASLDMAWALGCRSKKTSVKEDDLVESSVIQQESFVNVVRRSENKTSGAEGKLYVDEEEAEEDDEKTMACMRKASAKAIMRITENYYIWRQNPWCTFGPTIEEESDTAIITMHPLQSIEKGLFRDMPRIIGVVEDEGLVKTLGLYTISGAYDELMGNFTTIIPYMVEHHEIVANTSAFADAIISFYFEDNLNETLMYNITELVGDGLITWPTYEAVKYQSDLMNSSTYFYMFSYKGTFSSTFTSGMPVRYGVCHMDDLNYLFPLLNNQYGDLLLHNTLYDRTMINIMTEMWSNFAKHGVPRAWLTAEWPDYRAHREFMRLGAGRSPNITIESDFLPSRMEFWEDLMANVSVSVVDPDVFTRNPAYDWPENDPNAAHTRSLSSLACLVIVAIASLL